SDAILFQEGVSVKLRLPQPSDVLTFGNNVFIIASSTMNFVMQCLVPPGDVNQLTINAGYVLWQPHVLVR
ncbi:hypothetical protein, partial [Escherichia coli]|uniref:hypothetical protein n=1 Tax=Escherichia coli TaxID=562 RepID=UPI0021F07952